MKIEFYKHNINESDIKSVNEVLRSLHLTTGAIVEEFEKLFAEFLGINHVIGTTSWTSSAEIVLRGWNIGKGDEVILPAMTYVSTANVIAKVGAKPVFVDIDNETGLIDLNEVEKKITQKTKAIIPVHLYGNSPDMEKIKTISKKYKLKILNDAAHAIEARWNGKHISDFADATCFSFYATKSITCGEGGAIATNDSALAEYCRKAIRAGTNKSVTDRANSKKFEYWDCDFVSGKANMTNIQASLLIGQLKRLDSIYTKRKNNYQYFETLLANSEVKIQKINSNCSHAYLLFVVRVNPNLRDDLINYLREKGVGTAINFKATHLLKVYQNQYSYKRGDFPNAELWGDSCITLPLYSKLTKTEIKYIVKTLNEGINTLKH